MTRDEERGGIGREPPLIYSLWLQPFHVVCALCRWALASRGLSRLLVWSVFMHDFLTHWSIYNWDLTNPPSPNARGRVCFKIIKFIQCKI